MRDFGEVHMPSMTDALHARFFTTVGRLPTSAGRSALRVLFGLKYLRPDPWGYQRQADAAIRRSAIAAACACEPIDHALEIGCGEGYLTEILASTGVARRVTGIDVAGRAIRRARHRVPASTFIHGDARHVSLPKADLILVADLLYYVGTDRELAAVVARLVDVLQPGGRLILSHPLRWSFKLHGPADQNPLLRRISSDRYASPTEVHAVDVWRRVALEGMANQDRALATAP